MSTAPLFDLGRMVATPGALDLLERSRVEVLALIGRHVTGDWGNVPAEDAEENELSVREGFRILSSYDCGTGKVWILTEADRSATTILLPSDY